MFPDKRKRPRDEDAPEEFKGKTAHIKAPRVKADRSFYDWHNHLTYWFSRIESNYASHQRTEQAVWALQGQLMVAEDEFKRFGVPPRELFHGSAEWRAHNSVMSIQHRLADYDKRAKFVPPAVAGSPPTLTPASKIKFLSRYAKDLGGRANEALLTLAARSSICVTKQQHFGWDIGDGICAALCLEYAYRRSLGEKPAVFLKNLGDQSTSTRLLATQNMIGATWDKPSKIKQQWEHARKVAADAKKSPKKYLPMRESTAWLASEFLAARHDLIDEGSKQMREQLDDAWPSVSAGNIDIMEFNWLHICKPEFSLEAFKRYAPNNLGIVASKILASVPLGIYKPSDPTEDDKQLAIAKDWKAWAGRFKPIADNLQTSTYLPVVFLTLVGTRDGPEAIEQGHAIVLDFMPNDPGIYDPNIGFIPLLSENPLDDTFLWLMCLVAMTYHVSKFDLRMTLKPQHLPETSDCVPTPAAMR